MFLKSITINNYKSIQKATVGFENGLNIIIGKNGAGKSNLLQFINQAVFYPSLRGHIRFSKNNNLEYQYAICDEEGDSINELIIHLKRDRNVSKGENEYSNEVMLSKIKNEKAIYINESLKNVQNNFPDDIHIIRNFRRVYVSFKIPDNPFWLEQPNKYELGMIDGDFFPNSDEYYDGFDIIFELNNMIEAGISSQETVTFENVKDIFLKIFENFNERYQLNYYLSEYSPIQEVRVSLNTNVYQVENKILVTNLLLDFKVNDNWIPWSYLSDGSKRLFYLITQCLSLKDGLLLIEEPELGVHPHQLYSIMIFLKEQSADKQIIISTHSPLVLDILDPDELGKIKIAKIENGGSKFYKLTDEQTALAKEYMQDVADLSDYWVHSDLENNYAETND